MSLLPVVHDRTHYSELFKENQHWLLAVSFIAKKHELNGAPERGVLGSHIVYRVGSCWIKLMAPLFAQDMDFEISGLKAVAQKLSVPTPQILAEGILEGWRYVVIRHVEGKPVRDLWKAYSLEKKLNLAAQMARISKEISQCSADQIIQERFSWNDFISDQYSNVEEQQRKKSLPEGWIKTLGPWMKSFDIAEFQTPHPVFLHADLTFDHFLVAENGASEVTGVIDLADCQMGHFEYELIAPCAFIFKSESLVLREFLIHCGFQESMLNRRFSEKLLAWSILHRYFNLSTCLKAEMADLHEGDFSKLAARVYPLP